MWLCHDVVHIVSRRQTEDEDRAKMSRTFCFVVMLPFASWGTSCWVLFWGFFLFHRGPLAAEQRDLCVWIFFAEASVTSSWTLSQSPCLAGAVQWIHQPPTTSPSSSLSWKVPLRASVSVLSLPPSAAAQKPLCKPAVWRELHFQLLNVSIRCEGAAPERFFSSSQALPSFYRRF